MNRWVTTWSLFKNMPLPEPNDQTPLEEEDVWEDDSGDWWEDDEWDDENAPLSDEEHNDLDDDLGFCS